MRKFHAQLAVAALFGGPLALVSFVIVFIQFYIAGQRGIYWTCLDDSGFKGEGSANVTWELSPLPTGFSCIYNGEVVSFHDVGTVFTAIGLFGTLVLFLALAIFAASWFARTARADV